uniref:Cysteine protease ATG4D n=1 Tax=Xenopus laevis TaxID=8355 RepID=ATG4D_XENLA|nr:RecName: Full=Cysteine protease ATG4D; AltName: Full=Autophagy-related protein 4 homolog D; Short=Autophagin-4 [Xenopus laevis]AAH79754.1 MGC84754 protein [Xenopus laevis]
MNSVSPLATQYGSPKGSQQMENRSTQSGGHEQRKMGHQDATLDGEADEVDKLKSKLLSAWNNVKYGWSVKMKTTFSRSAPVYLLGERYFFRLDDEIERFQKDFVSRVWLTYRRDFPALEGTALTTDCGWGCMIRSGQMLLAQGLLLHLLSREWTWSEALYRHFVEMEPIRSSSPPSMPLSSLATGHSAGDYQPHTQCSGAPHGDQVHRNIMRWFSDHPGSPFGLHQLVTLGSIFGKKAGDWYGPSIVAHIIKKAIETSSEVPELSVYVSQDCTVYKADIEQLFAGDVPHAETSRGAGKAVIILVPVRLGGETFNPVYKHCLKEFLRMPSCLGIIGGKPKHSLYFIGYQDNYLLYLDPHYCQPYIDTSKNDFPLESFHCNSPRKISITRMDPSCTFAFYAKNSEDFGKLCDHLMKVLHSPRAEEKYPIFSISEGQAQEYAEGPQSSSHPPVCRKKGPLVKRPSSDEFEFL